MLYSPSAGTGRIQFALNFQTCLYIGVRILFLSSLWLVILMDAKWIRRHRRVARPRSGILLSTPLHLFSFQMQVRVGILTISLGLSYSFITLTHFVLTTLLCILIEAEKLLPFRWSWARIMLAVLNYLSLPWLFVNIPELLWRDRLSFWSIKLFKIFGELIRPMPEGNTRSSFKGASPYNFELRHQLIFHLAARPRSVRSLPLLAGSIAIHNIMRMQRLLRPWHPAQLSLWVPGAAGGALI